MLRVEFWAGELPLPGEGKKARREKCFRYFCLAGMEDSSLRNVNSDRGVF